MKSKPILSFILFLLLIRFAPAGELTPAALDYRASLDKRRTQADYKRIAKVTSVQFHMKKVPDPEGANLLIVAEGVANVGSDDAWLFPVSWELKDGILELEFVAIEAASSAAKSAPQPMMALFKVYGPWPGLRGIRVIASTNSEEHLFGK